MTDGDPGTTEPDVPTSLLRLRRLVELCLQFEQAWNSGQAPRIEAFLERAGIVDRATLLGDLLAIEINHRRRRGEQPTPADYTDRFPDDRAIITAAFESPTDRTVPPELPPPELEPAAGVTIGGRYSLISRLGSGSFAIVYAAHDTVLNRRVAVKVIRPQYARDADALKRFTDEAQSGATLEHPGIVPIHDYGRLDSGTPYFVMRLVQGHNLKEELESLAMAWRTMSETDRTLRMRGLLRRFLDVCDALAYGHKRGLLHRDIKPANIMLSDDGPTFLVDWGLVEALSPDEPHAESPGEATVTYDSTRERGVKIAGTPAYMSPAAANGLPLDPTDDLYAMGATLFAILSRGRHAVEGRHVYEVLARVRAGQVRWLRDVEPAAPRALAEVCRKAMAFERKDRYPSARALADDVARWLAGEPVTAYREPIWIRAGRLARRHSGATAALALLPLVGMIALGIHDRQIAAEHKLTMIALNGSGLARREALASYNAALAAVRDTLVELTSRALPQVPGTDVIRRRIAEKAERQLIELHASRPADHDGRALLAEAGRELGNTYRLIGDPRAVAAYRRALEEYKRLADELPLTPNYPAGVCGTRIDLAEYHRMNGRPAEALAELVNARPIAEELRERFPDSLDSARLLGSTLLNHAAAGSALGDFAESARLAREAAGLLGPVADAPSGPADRVLVIWALIDHGHALHETGRPEDALVPLQVAARRAAEIRPDAPDGRDAAYAVAVADGERGRALAALPGRGNDAAVALDAAVEALACIAAESPAVPQYREASATALDARAALRAEQGRRDDARADAKKAAGLLEDLLAAVPEHSQWAGRLGIVLGRLATWAADAGDPAAARTLAERAVEYQCRSLQTAPDHPRYREALERHRLILER